MAEGQARQKKLTKGVFLLRLFYHGAAGKTRKTMSTEDEKREHSPMWSWAKEEIRLAIARERADSSGEDEWDYGVACYESAMRAFESLLQDEHSGMSIQITKSILNRLIDGKCLTPIEDTPVIWNLVTKKDGGTVYQCRRMSSLFKKVDENGAVTYSDIDRVTCFDVNAPEIGWNNGWATRLINELFPVTMPYMPGDKPFRLFKEVFLVDPKKGDYDTMAFLYVIKPDGEKVEINQYFKEDDVGRMVPIGKEEYESRKENGHGQH